MTPAHHSLAHRISAALSIALLLFTAPLAAQQQPGSYGPANPGNPLPIPVNKAFENNLVAFDFRADGTDLELISARSKVPGALPIAMADGSGGWTLRLAKKDVWPPVWLEISSDGSVCDSGGCSNPSVGSLDDLRLEYAALSEPFDRLDVRWSGVVTFEGTTVPFVVDADWRMLGNLPFVSTKLGVRLQSRSPLPFYLSHVVYPKVRVEAFDTDTDELVVPWVTGSLVRDPTNPAFPFPDWLGNKGSFLGDEGTFLPVSMSAYYDGREPVSNGLIYLADVGDHYWKDLLIEVTPDQAGPLMPGSVDWGVRHVPDDIYASREYTMPYDVRIGAIPGDWWEAVDMYRFFLENEVPWYQGPVGAQTNPMPTKAKKLVAEVWFQPGFHGDHMDMINQQMMDMSRVLGSNVSTIWYGWHAPDQFNHFQLDGSLPGRPSDGAAFREATKQFEHFAAPYYNAASGAWWADVIPPIGTPSQHQLDVAASFTWQEDNERLLSEGSANRTGFLDPGAQWWRDEMPDQILDLAEFLDMNGIYLDVFLSVPNFLDDPTTRLHPPGGGRWMFDERMTQMALLESGLPGLAPDPGDFLITMEFVLSRFTEKVHVMHTNPAENLLSANENPAHPDAEPMENAVTIPLFRALYDNVKLSRITQSKPNDISRYGWIVANNVLTFGQITGIMRPAPELVPIFSDRFAFAPFFGSPFIPNDPVGMSGGGGTAPPGPNPPPGPGDSLTQEESDAITTILGPFPEVPPDTFNAPFYEFVKNVNVALRGEVPADTDGDGSLHGNGGDRFLKWHNGTIRRLPNFQETQIGGPPFTGIPGVELNPDPATPYTMTPVYTEQYPVGTPDPFPAPVGPLLVPGMFQAPSDAAGSDADSLAFILVNPWVDPTQAATFQVDFTVRPDTYPRWRFDGVVNDYSVVRYDVSGDPPVNLGNHTGQFVHTDTLPPGAIVWWVFRKL